MARRADDPRAAQRHIGFGAVALDVLRRIAGKAGDDGGQRLVAAQAHHGVHFRNLLHDLLLVALGQAAGDHHLQVGVGLLVLAGREDVLNGLGFGAFNEAAGVDDDAVGLRKLRRGGVAVLDEGMAEHVRVHLIFGAAQRNDGNFHRVWFPFSLLFGSGAAEMIWATMGKRRRRTCGA